MHKDVAYFICGRRTKWVVLVFWIAVLAVAGPLAGKLTDAQDNTTSSWLPGDAESTKALERSEVFVSPDQIQTVVVYERSDGITAADEEKAAADAAEWRKLPDLDKDAEVTGPVKSKDGQALQTVVPLDLGPNGWEKAADVVKEMRATAADGADGMVTHITGPGGNAADSAEAFEGIDSTLLFAAAGVVIVILLITYRSPILWLLPVLSAGTALAGAQAVIYLLAEHAGLTVNAQSAGILTVLVFGAGTDYALLLVARYREELRDHEDRHEAMAVALHRAGPAIIASAGTVVLGMLALLVASMNSTQSLGPVAAIGIVVGLLAMITLLPALLMIFGRWMFWPLIPHEGSHEPTTSGFWARVGNWMRPRPRRVWIVTSVILGALAFGIFNLNAHYLETKDTYTNTPDSVVGEEVAAKHFPAGAGSPVSVLTDESAATDVASTMESVNGISSVAPARSEDGTSYIEATLTDPPDSDAAFATIDRLRDAVHQVNADTQVGGFTAVSLDIERATSHDQKVVIPIVLVVVFVILMLLLRAVIAPLVLMLTVVLSFGAALGVSALVFDYIFGFNGADISVPLFVFVFLVALGIDYNIFLMTRVREEALKFGTRRGALIGLFATGGVITSAGLVLAGTFAVLATLPLVAFAEIGFAVAFGVLLDTIIVRSVLVTALNLDIGKHMWWPSQLGHKDDVEPEDITAEDALARS